MARERAGRPRPRNTPRRPYLCEAEPCRRCASAGCRRPAQVATIPGFRSNRSSPHSAQNRPRQVGVSSPPEATVSPQGESQAPACDRGSWSSKSVQPPSSASWPTSKSSIRWRSECRWRCALQCAPAPRRALSQPRPDGLVRWLEIDRRQLLDLGQRQAEAPENAHHPYAPERFFPKRR